MTSSTSKPSRAEGVKLTAAVKRAAQAHTNLTMFHAIIRLAESGCFYGPHPELNQIITIAKRAAGRQLAIYDTAGRQALEASR